MPHESTTLNLDEGTLQGFKLGSELVSGSTDSSVRCLEDGYFIGLEAGIVSSITVVTRTGYEGYKAFGGSIICEANQLQFQERSTLAELVSVFGQPRKEWNDGVERCAIFKLGSFSVEAVWHVDVVESLNCLCLEVW